MLDRETAKYLTAFERSDHVEKLYDKIEEMQEELDYLSYFFAEANFGPAHDDVVCIINDSYGKPLPKGYFTEEEL